MGAWLPVPFRGPEVSGHPQWFGSNFQGSGRRLGTDPRLGGYCEYTGGFDEYMKGAPGDYGFKVLTSSDPEMKKKKLNAEIANGRLAVMAIIGMFFQNGLTGSAWGDWSLYTASPLRAADADLRKANCTAFFLFFV